MKKYIILLILLIVSFFVIGCSQSPEKEDPTMPVANAGADQTVFVNYQCQLDGSASTGNLAAYQWTVVDKPGGAATPTITNSTSNKAYFTPDTLGTYEFKIELSNDLGTSTDNVLITAGAWSKPSSIDAGFYGVCAHLDSRDGNTDTNLTQSISKMTAAGVQFVRFDFNWKDIETSDDVFNFTKYDNIMSKLGAASIKVLGVLAYESDFANPTTGNTTHINRYADYVYNTVKHFKGKVKYWQIWNEPNNMLFWLLQEPNAQSYSKLLMAAYAAVKQADPDAVVVLGGLVGDGNSEYTITYLAIKYTFAKANFLSDIYKNIGTSREYFDVVAIHPYNYANPTESTASLTDTGSIEAAISRAKQVMSSNSDSDKQLWVTELGPLFFPPNDIPNVGAPILKGDYTEAEIATWLNAIYANLKTSTTGKCDKLFWYELRDPAAGSTDFLEILQNPSWEGLLESDFSEKPAYTKYKALIK